MRCFHCRFHGVVPGCHSCDDRTACGTNLNQSKRQHECVKVLVLCTQRQHSHECFSNAGKCADAFFPRPSAFLRQARLVGFADNADFVIVGAVEFNKPPQSRNGEALGHLVAGAHMSGCVTLGPSLVLQALVAAAFLFEVRSGKDSCLPPTCNFREYAPRHQVSSKSFQA